MSARSIRRSASLALLPCARVAGAAAVFLLDGCSNGKAAEQQQQMQMQRMAVAVSVVKARRVPFPYTIESNGVVMPVQSAAVLPQVDGIVKDVTFEEGQQVTKGQALFRIDPRPYQAALDQAQAALARDRATADQAQKDSARYELLLAGNVVTPQETEQRRAAAASANAIVRVDSAALATAKFNLDNTTVRAPISGRTGSLLVRQGNLVRGLGGGPLVVINQVRPILVRFAVSGKELPLIARYGGKGGLPVSATPTTATGVPPKTGDSAMAGGGDPPAGAGSARPRPGGGRDRWGRGRRLRREPRNSDVHR